MNNNSPIVDKTPKIVAIIQARMGSSRLPNKVMKQLCGKSVISHDIERVKQSKLINQIVIATTTSKKDDILVKEALSNNVNVYRGSEEDVLSRYYEAALENKADIVVRITSDCPLIDPFIVDNVIKCYLQDKYDLVTNSGNELNQRTFPRGLDLEVFSFESLEDAYKNARKQYQREHVTPYIYENSKKIYIYKNKIDFSKYRWTLDTEEDYELIRSIYEELYKGKHNFYFDDILVLFNEKPNLYNINKHIEQKPLNLNYIEVGENEYKI